MVWIAVSAGCPKAPQPAAGGPRKSPRVTTATVARVPLSWTIQAVGTVEPRDEITVAAGVAGVAGLVSFNEGDDVTPETVLVRVDEEKYTLEKNRAEADLARAQADLDHALVVWHQRKPLHDQKFISDEELAEAKAAHDRAAADKGRAEAALALAQKAQRDCSVRPPIAGRINSKGISTGEYVKAETEVARIVDLSELRVRFAVPESEAGRLAQGLKVTFEARAAQGTKVEAEVFWVSQMAEEKTRTVLCKARLAAPPAALKPGMSGTVSATLENRAGCLVIPAEAMLPTERGFIAYVVEGGKARERKVKPGTQTPDGKVEALEGLKEGDLVVVRGAGALRDGQDVEVVK
ncbi:MAG: RND family efflux transporter MFP [Planctomycetota bacterium]|nr:MAG: RND family efflux transporter MFP [Planctomycetota bacterium]